MLYTNTRDNCKFTEKQQKIPSANNMLIRLGKGQINRMQCKLTEMGVVARIIKLQKQHTRSRLRQYIINTNLICIVIQDISGQFCPH